eukprot:TRINITY_DN16592_c1_g1_i1.p1 TRINITY_DN16592_c1_g1~~TRINITY_DN16592_c1_g1_i1.p1  ORF type:complete len:854 (+),score=188.94 TRINITY_DN16592_c1_g1_i1:44-2605(+)
MLSCALCGPGCEEAFALRGAQHRAWSEHLQASSLRRHVCKELAAFVGTLLARKGIARGLARGGVSLKPLRRLSGVSRQACTSRADRDIAKALSKQDSVDDVGEVLPKRLAVGQKERWHASESIDASPGGEFWKVFSSPSPAKAMWLGEMSPQLAAAALEALLAEKEGQQIEDTAGRRLKSEVLGDVFSTLRADARELLAEIKETASDAQGDLDEKARAFLRRSWAQIVHGLGPGGTAVELRVARIFGSLLARVPNEHLCMCFEHTLTLWAGKAKRPRAGPRKQAAVPQRDQALTELIAQLRAPSLELQESQELALRALRTLRDALQNRSSKGANVRKKWVPLQPLLVAEVLAAVALNNVEALEDNPKVVEDAIKLLDVATVAQVRLWPILARASLELRLLLLDVAVAREASAIDTWAALGVEATEVVRLCVELVFQERKIHKIRLYNDYIFTRLRTKDLSSAMRAGSLLQRLAAEDDTILRAIEGEEAAQLATSLRAYLGSATNILLETVLKDAKSNPTKHVQRNLLAISKALPDNRMLADVLLSRWAAHDSEMLLAVMKELPSELSAATPGLRKALVSACQRNPSAVTRLAPSQLVNLLEAWLQSLPLPLSLRLLVVAATDRNVLRMNAHHLAVASRLASSRRANEEDRESAEACSEATLRWWRVWLRSSLSTSYAGWGRCREAIREVSRWQRDEEAVHEVLTIVVEELCKRLREMPLEMIFDLLPLTEHSQEAQKQQLESELDRRVQACLNGKGPALPLATAVAVANGDTPVACEEGTLLWSWLVALIQSQLTSHEQVDYFCRSQPSQALWDAVMLLQGPSWQSLELQMRRPSTRGRMNLNQNLKPDVDDS